MKKLVFSLGIFFCASAIFAQSPDVENTRHMKNLLDSAPRDKYGTRRIDYGPCDTGPVNYWIYKEKNYPNGVGSYLLCKDTNGELETARIFPDKKTGFHLSKRSRKYKLFHEVARLKSEKWYAVDWSLQPNN